MAAAAKPPGARPKDPKQASVQARIDPAGRPIGGSVRFEVINQDKRFKYVGVFRGDEDATASYDFQGYEPVIATEGGPRIRGVRRVELGQPLEWKGHVVMAVARDQWQADYDAGQAYGDRKSAAMVGKGGARKISRDPMIPVENETTNMGDFYEEAPANG